MNFDDITPDMKKRAFACKNTQELIDLAQSTGIELSDEQLEAISGGSFWDDCETFLDCRGDFE